MKRSLASVPQLYRNVKRWTEIVSVLSKYGLADWLSRFNIDFVTDLLGSSGTQAQSQLTHNSRIRLALTELGPTFIKFGQLLSTRPDLIGAELAKELEQLQSDAPQDPFEKIQQIIEEEQGRPLEEIFVEFDREPIASASIGQVHGARLRVGPIEELNLFKPSKNSGSSAASNGAAKGSRVIDVVVKVRHSGIERVVDTDLDILAGLASLAAKLDDFKNYNPESVVREMSRTMRRELDFEREERNLKQFLALFENEPDVIVPTPISELSSTRMITMQRISGTKLRDMRDTPPQGVVPAEVARSGANLYLKMIFNHGFYHADPHPGNLIVTDDGKIGLLDFGMVGRISEQLREDIEAMLVAIVNQDVLMLTALIKRVGNCPMELDESALSNDIADFVGQYSTQMVAHFDMSGALNDLFRSSDATKFHCPARRCC